MKKFMLEYDERMNRATKYFVSGLLMMTTGFLVTLGGAAGTDGVVRIALVGFGLPCLGIGVVLFYRALKLDFE